MDEPQYTCETSEIMSKLDSGELGQFPRTDSAPKQRSCYADEYGQKHYGEAWVPESFAKSLEMDLRMNYTPTSDQLPPPMLQVLACIQHELSGAKEYAILEYIPPRHHLMQDDPDDQGDADDEGNNWWTEGWYSSLPESGQKTSYDDMRFPINEADHVVIGWMKIPNHGNPAKTIQGQYTGHTPCKKGGKSHWMHGACEPARTPPENTDGFFDLSRQFLRNDPVLWDMMGRAGTHLLDAAKLLDSGDNRSKEFAEVIRGFINHPLKTP